MSGEITIKERNLKAELVALAASGATAFALTMLVFRFVDVGGAAGGAVIALTAYVLCRVLYGRLNLSGTVRRIAWTLTDTELVIDGKTIPRTSIRKVYCWSNRDAFGHERPGHVVNIETDRKNTLLRSADTDAAAQELETLVRALDER
ncbi:MAG: hypothetical protein IJR72_00610 [Oscillospiraceae bacterium]|nr:hypothetical protein [Oscillospiraceae bacterium]